MKVKVKWSEIFKDINGYEPEGYWMGEATPIEVRLCKTADDHNHNEAAGIACDCFNKPKPHRMHNHTVFKSRWNNGVTSFEPYEDRRLNEELDNLHARITELERRVK